ncbi:MAG: hypothetical protein ACI4OX_03470 [Akkermansia sp.]
MNKCLIILCLAGIVLGPGVDASDTSRVIARLRKKNAPLEAKRQREAQARAAAERARRAKAEQARKETEAKRLAEEKQAREKRLQAEREEAMRAAAARAVARWTLFTPAELIFQDDLKTSE